MSGRYRSIDVLQSKLGEGVFSYASDKKKAAGRALGTFVEIITYYLLKDWGLLSGLAIERGLSEFANPGVTHNVEFTLHPNRAIRNLVFGNEDIPLTARKILGKGIVTGRVRNRMIGYCFLQMMDWLVLLKRWCCRKKTINFLRVAKLFIGVVARIKAIMSLRSLVFCMPPTLN